MSGGAQPPHGYSVLASALSDSHTQLPELLLLRALPLQAQAARLAQNYYKSPLSLPAQSQHLQFLPYTHAEVASCSAGKIFCLLVSCLPAPLCFHQSGK